MLAAYARPDLARSTWQLGSSFTAFAILWYLALLSVDYSYLLTAATTLPAGILVVRLFIIQHDCGHGAFFASRHANDIVGSALGVVTLTPYAYWRKLHAMHHATSGNLDRRGFGDIDTLTVREYVALGKTRRFRYRLLRSPVVVFVIGPAYQFFLHHRLPVNLPLALRREWTSVIMTNISLAILLYVASQTVGIGRFLIVHVPVIWIAASIGVWLFYVQHQFEQTYWERDGNWSFEAAGVAGSSYYDLPRILHWCTGNIGFHHLHHLCPRIPNYRLRSCVTVCPDLLTATRITLVGSLRSTHLKLWDERQKKLVRFRDVDLTQMRAGSLQENPVE